MNILNAWKCEENSVVTSGLRKKYILSPASVSIFLSVAKFREGVQRIVFTASDSNSSIWYSVPFTLTFSFFALKESEQKMKVIKYLCELKLGNPNLSIR